MNVPDESDFTRCYKDIVVAGNTPAEQAISVSEPIFNLSPAAHHEPENTAIVFFFKPGCDVHRMDGELGVAINDFIRLEFAIRYNEAVQEEMCCRPEITGFTADMDVEGVVIDVPISVNESYNGEVRLRIRHALSPSDMDVAIAIQKRIRDSISAHPVKFFVFEIEYEVMFCGCGLRFF